MNVQVWTDIYEQKVFKVDITVFPRMTLRVLDDSGSWVTVNTCFARLEQLKEAIENAMVKFKDQSNANQQTEAIKK
jgi:hypothetical protein